MRRTPHMRPLLPVCVSVTALGLLAGCAWNTPEGEGSQPPDAPRGVTVQAGSATSVHVMWNKGVSAADISGYEVYRDAVKVKDVPAEQHMVDITGLKPKSTYSFTVRARDDDGTLSADSKKLTVTTPAATTADSKAPTRPRTLRVKAEGGHAATLTWAAAKDDRGVASYEIFQGGSKIHSVGGGTTDTLITGLRPSTTYTFTVKARDAADNFSPRAPRRGSGPPRARTPAGRPHRRTSAPTRASPTGRTTSTCPGARRAPAAR
ncbi:fibronectin type III domain-containing protein [Streptomyces sp. G45]|uniref:fibronectin type III domain-containing protein n=1 Tax=Streptomyces sp. G45 TaxID=3406627 RepID=UPI003C1B07F3